MAMTTRMIVCVMVRTLGGVRFRVSKCSILPFSFYGLYRLIIRWFSLALLQCRVYREILFDRNGVPQHLALSLRKGIY